MNKMQFEEKLKKYIEEMPSLPVTVSKVLEICNQQNPSPNDLNRVISLDPVLLGKVLKLINSAYYGLSNKVTSLVRAIIMLGINTVKNLALSTAVLDHFSSNNQFIALDSLSFWRHSIGTAVIAKILARQRGVDPKNLEEYFIAGLLHDIGKIPMNEIESAEFLMSINFAEKEGMPLHQAEKLAFGQDHTEVGSCIAESWQLDENLREVIRYHHNPQASQCPKSKDVLYTISVANYFAGIADVGFSGNRKPENPSSQVFDFLEISRDHFYSIEEDAMRELEKARIFLNL